MFVNVSCVRAYYIFMYSLSCMFVFSLCGFCDVILSCILLDVHYIHYIVFLCVSVCERHLEAVPSKRLRGQSGQSVPSPAPLPQPANHIARLSRHCPAPSPAAGQPASAGVVPDTGGAGCAVHGAAVVVGDRARLLHRPPGRRSAAVWRSAGRLLSCVLMMMLECGDGGADGRGCCTDGSPDGRG